MSLRRVLRFLLRGLILSLMCATPAIAKPVITAKVDASQTTLDANAALWKYGGGIWHTPVAIDWVEGQVDGLRRVGTFRASIGWEVLAASENLEDVKRKLAVYPLNGFLQRMHAKGANVIVCLDAMPRWLASDPSSRKLADGPAWAKSPPRNYADWSRVVEEVVRHFNLNLKLNAYYEVWNEPDWAWEGSSAEYFSLYKASAEGALRGDVSAKLGGPAISDWMAVGSKRDPEQASLFLKRFFAYVAANPMPAYKRPNLPLAFVSWHSFYREPGNVTSLVPKFRRWLSEASLAPTTPLFINEWNIASEPPYPEGDLNATHFGAAFVAASLLAMETSGIDGQVFQMVVDPGSDGYSGGTFAVTGLPRSNWLTFRLFDMISGRQHPVSTSHDWVRAAAFESNDALFVITSVLVPTERMMLQSLFERHFIDSPDTGFALRKFDKSQLIAFVKDGARMPTGLSDDLVKRLRPLPALWQQYRAERQFWERGIELELILPPIRTSGSATRYLIDASHTIEPRVLEQAGREMRAQLDETKRRVAARFQRAATPEALQKRFAEGLQRGLKLNQETLDSNPTHASVLSESQRDVRDSFAQAFKGQRTKLGPELRGETLTLPTALQTLRFSLESPAVQLLIIKK